MVFKAVGAGKSRILPDFFQAHWLSIILSSLGSWSRSSYIICSSLFVF